MLIINTMGQAIFYHVYSSNTLIKEGELQSLKVEEIPLSDSDFNPPVNNNGVVNVYFDGGPNPAYSGGDSFAFPVTATIQRDNKDGIIQFSLIAPV